MRRRDLLWGMGAWLAAGGTAQAHLLFSPRLILINANTGETFSGRYRDGRGPDPRAMADLAALLRDHHTGTIGPLEVALIDLLADVMAAIGQTKATILSGYRTRATNARLGRTTFGVAERSQHMFGRAVDVYFDRHLAEAAAIARGMRRGGVGWYPQAHFVHLDVGPVRHWELGDQNLRATLADGLIAPTRTLSQCDTKPGLMPPSRPATANTAPRTCLIGRSGG